MRKYQARFGGGLSEKERCYLAGSLPNTNDGRKLALDQRMMNDMLPDFEDSKVNACVGNVFDIWERNTDKKSAQLVFCDRVAIRCYK